MPLDLAERQNGAESVGRALAPPPRVGVFLPRSSLAHLSTWTVLARALPGRGSG